MLSLYLHTPFCRRKCAYCAFYSMAAGEEPKDRYLAAMKEAIRGAAAEEKRPLSTLYLGGGTPALLGEARLSELLQTVAAHFTFAPQAERTVELNPESTTPQLLATLRKEGINRISLGVQSLNDEELQTLGRLHDRQGALRALEMVFEAGFTNVSVDVMFGLPDQTEERFEETLDTLLSYPITHLSAYSLQLEEGTPLGEQAEPMDEELEEQLWWLLCRKAREQGLEHYEISNFAKAGYASRHNTAYWKRTDYIGLGPAAHSFWKGVRYSYPADLAAFCQAPWPLCNPEPISYREAAEEAVMLGLRLQEGVPLEWLPAGFDHTRYDSFGKVENGRFSLNERGFALSNSIISDILYRE